MREIIDNLFICSADEYDDFCMSLQSTCNYVAIRASLITFVRTVKRLRKDGINISSLSPYIIDNNELIVKLRDSHRLTDINPVIIDKALEWVHTNISDSIVIIHCSKGQSRSPSIGMLYLQCIGYFGDLDFEKSEEIFKNIYPDYAANKGIHDYMLLNWTKYRNVFN